MRDLLIFICLFLTALLLATCGQQESNTAKSSEPQYLNHADSARYVGMATCKQCHQSIYESFIKTGMGKSFALASKQKSSANFEQAHIYDAFSDYHYVAGWYGDSLRIEELRLAGKDTVHQLSKQVNYIIGSGQHTNSHIRALNGYLYQMPMTFYTQKQHWDLPPGFENGVNTRFSRKIGLECMSCHNGYPQFVTGSENKYRSVPQGIDCERCHGPGSIHVAQRSTQTPIDTSKYIDYSIVNPAKLSIDRQFDVCMRCHLQGNTVLKEDKSFYDFKPGQTLSEVMTVFLPKFKNADDEFIMASHADRLKQSACFIKSAAKAGTATALKPYRNALTCVTCHNPHVSVRETQPNVFNDACLSCHKEISTVQMHAGLAASASQNCVGCHMPKSGSIDIPHVTVHDHYIRKPKKQTEVANLKTFVGLVAINEKQPDALTKAKAYVAQYEKFEQLPYYLDSAKAYVAQVAAGKQRLQVEIHLAYVSHDPQKIIAILSAYGNEKALRELNKQSVSNENAWTSYRISEAYQAMGQLQNAITWMENACKLASYQLDFKNKLATFYASTNAAEKAMQLYAQVLQENDENIQALVNSGYLILSKGDVSQAKKYYEKAYEVDPDYENLLLNYAGWYLYTGNTSEARKLLLHCVKKHPNNQKAKLILAQINGNG